MVRKALETGGSGSVRDEVKKKDDDQSRTDVLNRLKRKKRESSDDTGSGGGGGGDPVQQARAGASAARREARQSGGVAGSAPTGSPAEQARDVAAAARREAATGAAPMFDDPTPRPQADRDDTATKTSAEPVAPEQGIEVEDTGLRLQNPRGEGTISPAEFEQQFLEQSAVFDDPDQVRVEKTESGVTIVPTSAGITQMRESAAADTPGADAEDFIVTKRGDSYQLQLTPGAREQLGARRQETVGRAIERGEDARRPGEFDRFIAGAEDVAEDVAAPVAALFGAGAGVEEEVRRQPVVVRPDTFRNLQQIGRVEEKRAAPGPPRADFSRAFDAETLLEEPSTGATLFGTQARERAIEREATEGSVFAQTYVGGESLERVGREGSYALNRLVPEGPGAVKVEGVDLNPRISFGDGKGPRVLDQARNWAVGGPAGIGTLAALGPKAAGDIGLRAEETLGRDVSDEALITTAGTTTALGAAGSTLVTSAKREPVGVALDIVAPFAAGKALSRFGSTAKGVVRTRGAITASRRTPDVSFRVDPESRFIEIDDALKPSFARPSAPDLRLGEFVADTTTRGPTVAKSPVGRTVTGGQRALDVDIRGGARSVADTAQARAAVAGERTRAAAARARDRAPTEFVGATGTRGPTVAESPIGRVLEAERPSLPGPPNLSRAALREQLTRRPSFPESRFLEAEGTRGPTLVEFVPQRPTRPDTLSFSRPSLPEFPDLPSRPSAPESPFLAATGTRGPTVAESPVGRLLDVDRPTTPGMLTLPGRSSLPSRPSLPDSEFVGATGTRGPTVAESPVGRVLEFDRPSAPGFPSLPSRPSLPKSAFVRDVGTRGPTLAETPLGRVLTFSPRDAAGRLTSVRDLTISIEPSSNPPARGLFGTYIPEKEIVPEDVMAGEANFPTWPRQIQQTTDRGEVLRAVGDINQRNTVQAIAPDGGRRFTLFHASPDDFAGSYRVGPGDSEVVGQFFAPALSRYFLGLRQGESSTPFQIGLPDLGPEPTAVVVKGRPRFIPESRAETDVLTWDGPEVVERDIGATSQFLQEQADPGTPYIKPSTIRKTEAELIYPPETKFVQTGEEFFTKSGVRKTRVPIRVFEPVDDVDVADLPDADAPAGATVQDLVDAGEVRTYTTEDLAEISEGIRPDTTRPVAPTISGPGLGEEELPVTTEETVAVSAPTAAAGSSGGGASATRSAVAVSSAIAVPSVSSSVSTPSATAVSSPAASEGPSRVTYESPSYSPGSSGPSAPSSSAPGSSPTYEPPSYTPPTVPSSTTIPLPRTSSPFGRPFGPPFTPNVGGKPLPPIQQPQSGRSPGRDELAVGYFSETVTTAGTLGFESIDVPSYAALSKIRAPTGEYPTGAILEGRLTSEDVREFFSVGDFDGGEVGGGNGDFEDFVTGGQSGDTDANPLSTDLEDFVSLR